MIYCVEDDNSIRDLMIYTLTIAGFEAKGFADSASFWKEMQTGRPELILLDIMLPGEDGISILKKLRSSPTTAALPVIMATAKGSEYDRVIGLDLGVIGLDLGADDYLCKPFGMMEMVSRIRAVLRRTSMSEHKNYLSYGAITMDQSRHVVLVDGREVSLTLKEYDLLKLLLEHTGLVFTRDQLLSSVWDQDYSGETRTVDVHIGTLRTKLGESGEAIRTVRGVGYRLG